MQKIFNTPIGPLTATFTEKGLRTLEFTKQAGRASSSLNPEMKILAGAIQDYFKGDFKSSHQKLKSLPLDFIGSPFQKKVWKELLKIPHGKTESYGELASRIGHPKAARAVGTAVGKNPVGVLIPCHRILGANQTLNGFGGGLKNKQWLLKHEGFVVSGATRTTRVLAQL